MGKLYDVVSPMGTYNDPNTGQEKTRWLNCGAIIRTQAGKVALKLDALPVNPIPNQDNQPGIWLQCMEPKPRQNTGQPAPQATQPLPQNPNQPAQPAQPAPAGGFGPDGFEDKDIPF